MKKFLIQLAFFVPLIVISFYITPLFLILSDQYKSTVAGRETYVSIKRSKTKHKTKKLLLGDSVAKQLFPDPNDTINSLACNHAISLAGQYFLLNNYIKTGNKPDTVYLLFSNLSFLNNLHQIYTYHYFLKPFYHAEYDSEFTPTVYEQIHKIPYHQFCREPYILTSNWAPLFTSTDSVDYTLLSPISIQYLNKIKALAHQEKFKLIILPIPMSIKSKPSVEKINRQEITDNNFEEEFKHYFQNIVYLDESCFSDEIHLIQPEKYVSLYNKITE